MKANKHILFSLFAAGIMGITHVNAQSNDIPDSTGLPGDNFSLQGALEMFKKASSVEEFEKLINTESNNINNLDLNNDGETDYVKVIDKKDGEVHAFVLQVAVSATENQDIAVIELEKNGNESAVLQIVGDEDIYGERTIVEPSSSGGDVSFVNIGDELNHGPSAYNNSLQSNNGIIVNVWFWPCVRFIYAPAYIVWVSPWHWHAYPVWWSPWRPVRYAVFYPRRAFYHPHYTIVHTNRIVRARTIYAPTRVTSVTVRTRNQATVTRYRTTRKTTVIKNNRPRPAARPQVQPTRRPAARPQVQPSRRPATRPATIHRSPNSRPVHKTTRPVNRPARRN